MLWGVSVLSPFSACLWVNMCDMLLTRICSVLVVCGLYAKLGGLYSTSHIVALDVCAFTYMYIRHNKYCIYIYIYI